MKRTATWTPMIWPTHISDKDMIRHKNFKRLILRTLNSHGMFIFVIEVL